MYAYRVSGTCIFSITDLHARDRIHSNVANRIIRSLTQFETPNKKERKIKPDDAIYIAQPYRGCDIVRDQTTKHFFLPILRHSAQGGARGAQAATYTSMK